jgi:hypothetical protein
MAALALYPDTNSQVLRPLAAFFEAVRENLNVTSKVVELSFSANAVWVGDEPFELMRGSTLAWLKDRLDRADLCGVVFSESADEMSLLAFTKRLLELYRRANMELRFEALWPEQYAGIVLLERRFDGGFSEHGGEEEGLARPLTGSARTKIKSVCDALAADPKIRGRIDEIQSKIHAAAERKAELSRIDIIDEIVRLLPAEGLHDYSAAAEMTEKVLAALGGELNKGSIKASLANRDQDTMFRHLLFVISRTHFNMESDLHSSAPARKNAAAEVALRDGDAEIHDDLDALLAEMSQLGSGGLPRNENTEDPAEQLGIFLHFIVTEDNPEKFPSLEQGVRRLLRSSDTALIEVLREYLEPTCVEGAPIRPARNGRVAKWLRRNGYRAYLDQCGVFSAAWACREFPGQFLSYLETLDLGNVEDLNELDGVCRQIGAQRFKNADLMSEGTELLNGPKPQQLFGLAFTSLSPLLRQIYEKVKPRYTAEFASFLRATTSKRLDKEILGVVANAQFLLSE